jgi:hypothetical protein
MTSLWTMKKSLGRREFIGKLAGGVLSSFLGPFSPPSQAGNDEWSDIFWIKNIPDLPFYNGDLGRYHAGADALLYLMGEKGLKFYCSDRRTPLSGPQGLIGGQDIVLIKVNAQWKYRGCTNSDLVRGLIQRILDHPDVFTGEVVIVDNGQGSGSLNCDTNARKVYPDLAVHANANDPTHSFLYLVEEVFRDPRVSGYLLDPLRSQFIGEEDHTSDGYRLSDDISYPCFTTAGGHRVELKEGIWNGRVHAQNLKLINVPVLKHHPGANFTASLKNSYGIVSMSDGHSTFRHYRGLGTTSGRFYAGVRSPVLNILDAIWVSHAALQGYPEDRCLRLNQVLASQDPLALDYWAAKNILYPIRKHPWHHPDHVSNALWLADALNTINGLGGLSLSSPGTATKKVTKREEEMRLHSGEARVFAISGRVVTGNPLTGESTGRGIRGVILEGLPGQPPTDSGGHYRSPVVSGWRGTVIPKKEGYSFRPARRSYSLVFSDEQEEDYLGFKESRPPRSSRRKKSGRSSPSP